jgi:IS4 transposase
MADRNFYEYRLWTKAVDSGANLLWRIKSNLKTPIIQRLPDNSYLSILYDNYNRRDCQPITVRIIEYKLKEKNKACTNEVYRLITTLFDCIKFPAAELASLYHERWEIENIYDEVKISLSANTTIIRSKIPELVLQDVWGLLLIHFAIRQLMANAAWSHELDPDKLSFKGAVHVVRRKIPQAAAFPPRED